MMVGLWGLLQPLSDHYPRKDFDLMLDQLSEVRGWWKDVPELVYELSEVLVLSWCEIIPPLHQGMLLGICDRES